MLRAGGGSVETLAQRAVEAAPAYEPLVAAGACRSSYTISVHVPRDGRITKEDLPANAPYSQYRPYLEAPARVLLELDFLDIVATTMVTEGRLSSIDLCHYDVVVEAKGEQ